MIAAPNAFYHVAKAVRAKRILRFEGQELGAFSVQQLIRMAERGLIDHTSEYWSEKVQEWRPLSNLISDLEGVPDHLEEQRAFVIEKTAVFGPNERPL